jgi:tetratricopeptide (TPR) repeat protein
MRAIMHKIFIRGPKMKKTVLTTLIMVIFVSATLTAQTTANDEYIKAMTTSNAEQRVKLLKEYLAKYAGRGTQYENFVCAALCVQNYAGKTYRETIEYGEKALALNGLDDLTKCKVLITVAGMYSQHGQNLEKAKNYASQIIEIAQADKNNNSTDATPEQWEKFIGAAYFTQGQALEKSKYLKEAVDSYINSYNILKDAHIANNLKKAGKSLYDIRFYKDAEKAFEIPVAVLKDFASYAFYAKTLYKNKKKEEALKYFKLAYQKQKSGEMAFYVGIILAEKAKSNPSVSQEAIRYLLDASLLSAANSKKAMALAESLFFNSAENSKYNENVKEIQKKSRKLENLTETFNKKFGEKEEEDLSDAQTKEMESMLEEIKTEEKNLQNLKAEQKIFLGKFNKLVKEAKQRLGIR